MYCNTGSTGSGCNPTSRKLALRWATGSWRPRGVMPYTVRAGGLPSRSVRTTPNGPSSAIRCSELYNDPGLMSVHSSARSDLDACWIWYPCIGPRRARALSAERRVRVEGVHTGLLLDQQSIVALRELAIEVVAAAGDRAGEMGAIRQLKGQDRICMIRAKAP